MCFALVIVCLHGIRPLFKLNGLHISANVARGETKKMSAEIKNSYLVPCQTSAAHKSKHKLNPALLFSLGLGICSLAIPSVLSAQENVALDFANPNVSVDFSVLDDGGAITGTSMSPIASGGGHLIPGTTAPVSTLYITPVGDFAKIEEPTPKIEEEPSVSETPIAPMPEAIAEPAVSEAPETEKVAKDMPEAPAPVPAIEEEPIKQAEEKLPEPPTEPAAEPVVSAPEIVKEEVAPPPEPAPIAEIEQTVTKPSMEMTKAEPEIPMAPPMAPPAAPEPTPAPAPISPVVDAKAPEAPDPIKVEPLKLEAQKVEEKVDQPISAPPPVAEIPQPPKVTAPLPGDAEKSVAEPTPAPPAPPAPSVASLPPSGGVIGEGYSMRVLFEPDSAKLPAAAREELSGLVANMTNNEDLRLQLLAYAGGAEMSASVARRLSLSRALAVRSYLIESGVRSTRIDVRALGNKTTDTDTERVDITIIER